MNNKLKKTPFVDSGINFYLTQENHRKVREFKNKNGFKTLKLAMEHILWFGLLVEDPERTYMDIEGKIKNYFDLPEGIIGRINALEDEYQFGDKSLLINTIIWMFFHTRLDIIEERSLNGNSM